MARIAVIGWGSLISNQGDLRLACRWHVDGPLLPVEFARKSAGMRVTLVIVPGYAHLSRSLWAMSAYDDLESAVDNLRVREGTAKRWIHVADGDGWRSALGTSDSPPSEIGLPIQTWLQNRDDVDHVLWTGLPPKTFNPDSDRIDLSDQVVSFLRSLSPDVESEARRYVELTPESVDTPVRQAIENELGWVRKDLDPSLFEEEAPSTSGELPDV